MGEVALLKIGPRLDAIHSDVNGDISMASYIPWYRKKRKHLAEHEEEFIPLLNNDPKSPRVAEAAEEVRAAQVRALRAKRAELPPSEKNAIAVENLDREIAFWLGLPIEKVIDGYRTGKLKGHRSTAIRRASR